jgi:DNA primase
MEHYNLTLHIHSHTINTSLSNKVTGFNKHVSLCMNSTLNTTHKIQNTNKSHFLTWLNKLAPMLRPTVCDQPITQIRAPSGRQL